VPRLNCYRDVISRVNCVCFSPRVIGIVTANERLYLLIHLVSALAGDSRKVASPHVYTFTINILKALGYTMDALGRIDARSMMHNERTVRVDHWWRNQ